MINFFVKPCRHANQLCNIQTIVAAGIYSFSKILQSVERLTLLEFNIMNLPFPPLSIYLALYILTKNYGTF